jgi:tetratricopeptide (TPR) repeat protein
VGRYHDAVEVNKHAAHADESHNFTPDQVGINNYSVGYYPHNIHFLFSAAIMEGNSKTALEAARKLVATIPVEAYAVLPQFELFPPSTLFAQVRFGLWDDVMKEAQPPAQLKYTTGVWHYARGMALVHKGNLTEAQKEQQQLKALATSDEMGKLGLLSFATAGQLLTLANGTLEAEIAGAQGDTTAQIKRLEEAVKLQDSLPYIEPPAWYFPVRHALGAVLLKANKAADAEAVYREDLRQYPKNGWSLLGLSQSLKAQGKDAADVQTQFINAWQYADVKLTASYN